MSYGYGTVTATAKSRWRVDIRPDELGLAALTFGDLDSGIHGQVNLNADELDLLLTKGSQVLAHLIDTKGIGVPTMQARHEGEIDRLAHILNRSDR